MRAAKGEEGGLQRSGAVERKDGGRPSTVESAAVEHGSDSRVGLRMGVEAAANREESKERSFCIKQREIVSEGVAVLGPLGSVEAHQCKSPDALPTVFPKRHMMHHSETDNGDGMRQVFN
jgi:hypothetical protein